MRRSLRLVISALLLACSVACSSPQSPTASNGGATSGGLTSSGGTASSGGAASSGDTESFCRAMCEEAQRCAAAPSATELATCTSDCLARQPPASVFKAGILATLTDCFSHLDCDVSDDTCLANVAGPNAEQNPDFVSCTSKQRACQMADALTTFRDDDCTAVFLTSEQATASFLACLTRDCSEVKPCIQAIIGPKPAP